MESAHLLIGMKVISWITGFLAFYLFSYLSRENKKLQLQEVASQLINFVIFIWAGKIVLNLREFIKSPLSILAYPSNSSSFYLAFFLIVILIVYKSKRGSIDALGWLESFMFVFLTSSFAYAFIQIVWGGNQFVLGYFSLLAVLILSNLAVQSRVKSDDLAVILVIGWSAGTLGLYAAAPLVIVFGYTIHPWFLGLLLVSSIVFYIFKKERRSCNWVELKQRQC